MTADEMYGQAVSDLANALQVALCVSNALNDDRRQPLPDVRKLQEALTRAATALHKLRGH